MPLKRANPAGEDGVRCASDWRHNPDNSTALHEIKGFISTSLLSTKARSQRVAGGIDRGYRFRWRRAR